MKNELLFEMQNAFPMIERPFKAVAEKLNTTEEEVLSLVQKLKDDKIIRQTSAIFDTKRLGYKSSLVAFKVDEAKIDEAAEIINAHPGVSHNYLRNHDYNIWFTMAVAPDSKLGLEKTIEILKERTGAEDAIILPTLKMFKISVKMDTTGKRAKKEKLKKLAHKEIELTPQHIAVIKELQKDIEVTQEPFKKAAMSVWAVPEEKGEEIGKEMAEFSAVSHCYLRPSYPNWPYNLFAMVHAKTQEECDTLIEEMAKESGLTEYGKLYSTVEFKKQRLVYFDDAFKAWEKDV